MRPATGMPLHRVQEGPGDLHEGVLLHRLQAGLRAALQHLQLLHPEGDLRAALPRGLRDHLQAGHDLLIKEVCTNVCRPVTETCMKQVCETCYKNVEETCYKDCVQTISKQVCSTKTVSKKCGEWVCESYCVPGKCKTQWVKTCDECCFDPCTCQSVSKPGKWVRTKVETPAETRTRKVWKEHTVCEQVPVTTTVKECVHTKGSLHRLQEGPLHRHQAGAGLHDADGERDHRQEGPGHGHPDGEPGREEVGPVHDGPQGLRRVRGCPGRDLRLRRPGPDLPGMCPGPQDHDDDDLPHGAGEDCQAGSLHRDEDRFGRLREAAFLTRSARWCRRR